MRGGVNTYYSQGIANSRINRGFLNAKHSINFRSELNDSQKQMLNDNLHMLIQALSGSLPTMCFSNEKNMTDIITIDKSRHGKALVYLVEIIKGQQSKNDVVSKGFKMFGKAMSTLTGSSESSLGKEKTIEVLEALKDNGTYEGNTCDLYKLRVRLTRMFPDDIAREGTAPPRFRNYKQ